MVKKQTELLEFLKDIFAALIFLTRIPLPWNNISNTPPDISRAFWAFPIIGLFFGIISGGIMLIFFSIGLPIFISVSLGILSLTAISGAIHEFALVNFLEGAIKGNSSEEKIQIMRENEISLLGILGIIFVILFKIGSIHSLFNNNYWYAFAGICGSALIGRSMIVFLKFISEKENEEDISAFDDKTEVIILMIAMGLTLLGLIIFVPFWVAITALFICIIVSFIVKIFSEKYLGKVTGHILGANEICCEVLFLLVFAFFYGIN